MCLTGISVPSRARRPGAFGPPSFRRRSGGWVVHRGKPTVLNRAGPRPSRRWRGRSEDGCGEIRRSLGNRGAGWGLDAQREPGLASSARTRAPPRWVLAGAGGARGGGGQKEGGCGCRASSLLGHRGTREAGVRLWPRFCCCHARHLFANIRVLLV